MCASSPRHVCFEDIPPAGRDFSWNIAALEKDADCTLDAPLQAQCHVSPKGADKVEIEGLLQGQVRIRCDRCLKAYPVAVHSAFQLQALVQSADPYDTAQDNHEFGLDELDIVELDIPCIDLNELMRQQLFLSLPEKRVCSDACAGLCPQCGADRNEEPCSCAQAVTDSPFAVLAKLSGKKAK